MTKASVKRKRNVFGKRIGRSGVIILSVFEIIIIIVAHFFLAKLQNDAIAYEKMHAEEHQAEIIKLQIESLKEKEEIENIGYLIPTLPTSFIQQECTQDINRLMNMSDVQGTSPTYSLDVTVPFTTTNTTTLKAVKIVFNVTTDDMNKLLVFIDYLTNYENERFFYISYIEISNVGVGLTTGTVTFNVYTFYNNVSGL